MPIPIALLTPLSLASISRGSPARKLSSTPTTLTKRIRLDSTLNVRSFTRPHTVRTAGGTLLQARAATVPSPRASLRR